MEDYIKRQIDMIGQMLILLAKKLGLLDGNVADYSMQFVQKEIKENGFDMDIDRILSEEHPAIYLVESLKFSDDALESFTEIVMHSDANEIVQQRLLYDAISYLDSRGRYSFSLHSYIN